MTGWQETVPAGSYDDLPETTVTTSLTVPLRLESRPAGAQPTTDGSTREKKPRGRHRADRAAAAPAPAPAPPPPARTQLFAGEFANRRPPVMPGTMGARLQVSLLAALSVLGAVALGLLVITWLMM